ncbi:unnamed protein product [Peniophora sp. CBMAI 1063]|nr:unnamed protein product [Peniophora sp. CBMAI 1063]
MKPTSQSEDASSMQSSARARWLDTFRELDAQLPSNQHVDVDIDQTRARIDAEVIGIRALLSAMNERRNQFALPSKLPPEVLAHIFLTLCLDVDPVTSQSSSNPRNPVWLPVAHVCRRWRHICIDRAPSWMALSLNWGPLWDDIVEQERGRQLWIEGYAGRGVYTKDRIDAILGQQHRLRSLALRDVPGDHLQRLLLGFMDPGIPLDRLSLRTSPESDGEMPNLHPQLLSNAVNLRSMDLTHVAIPRGAAASSFSNLAHFTIRFPRAESSQLVPNKHSFAEMTSILRVMPVLETLTVVNALEHYTPDSQIPDIQLPHLVYLEIRTEDISCWHLWLHLHVPPTATIVVDGNNLVEPALEPLIISKLCAHINEPRAPRFPICFVQNGNAGYLGFELTEEALSGDADGEGSDIGTGTVRRKEPSRITMQLFCYDAGRILQQIVHDASLDTVEHLGISGDNWDDDMFYDAFISLQSVTTLHLDVRDSAGECLQALAPAHARRGRTRAPEGEATLFPALARLRCTSVHFDDPRSRSIVNQYALETVIEDRAKDPCTALAQLDIMGCDVRFDWVERWRSFVGVLNWDFYEGSLEESDEEE